MSSNKPEPNDPNRAGGLWARLLGAQESGAENENDPGEEMLPSWDAPPTTEGVPVAPPVPTGDVEPESVPMAIPVAPPVPTAADNEEAVPVATPVEPTEPPGEKPEAAEPGPTAVEVQCPQCEATVAAGLTFCSECGFVLPEETSEAALSPPSAEPPRQRLAGRYEICETLSQRGQVTRYRGLDHGGSAGPVPVVIVQERLVTDSCPEKGSDAEVLTPDRESGPESSVEDGDDSGSACIDDLPAALSRQWPGIGWEWQLLQQAACPLLPRVVDHFAEEGSYYLVEEAPSGRVLWDVWDDPELSPTERFNCLAELADGLRQLHEAGAMLEGLRPDFVHVTDTGQPKLNDLSDLLPLPLPNDPPVQATAYTAPELVLEPNQADARAELYSFGAMLYALFLGRELTDLDFQRQGVPKEFVLQFPDAHPAMTRLLMKTFVRDREHRFPTDEGGKNDPTGFEELSRVLRAAGSAMTCARLDVAGWTTTGMVRTNNEDAFAYLQAVGSKEDSLGDRVLVILADGMGGYEAGEVASAMALKSLRRLLLEQPIFASLVQDADLMPGELDVAGCSERIKEAFQETNREIYSAARAPGGKPGMGCTAEVVYTDGCHVVFGHVGDSRIYHYCDGRLVQLTRDQTLVNRLVELGQLSPEEAANHERKNELQQALGGQPMVEAETGHVRVKPGDWLIVCSDGITNHVDDDVLTDLIQRAQSAEMLARRLVNLANLQGGTDNATVVAIRIT